MRAVSSSERLLAGRAARPVVDASHWTLMRTNQGRQRQAGMGDLSCWGYKLSGDVRSSTQNDRSGVLHDHVHELVHHQLQQVAPGGPREFRNLNSAIAHLLSLKIM